MKARMRFTLWVALLAASYCTLGCATAANITLLLERGQSNFRWSRLQNVDLHGKNLSEKDFRNADLRGADLSGADLTGALLGGADLRNAVLRNAILAKADLAG